MENIFKNAKIGDCFLTRDGRKAVCDGLPYFSIEGYKEHGIVYISGDKDTTYLTPWLEEDLKGCGDIVSKYQEEISEGKIDEVAYVVIGFLIMFFLIFMR